MKRSTIVIRAMMGAAVLSLVLVPATHAYLDPGTGSYLLQLLIAGLFGLLLSIKIFGKNIKAFFAGLFSKEQPEGERERHE
jgi:hypothetical protein